MALGVSAVSGAMEIPAAQSLRPPTAGWIKQTLSNSMGVDWTEVEYASVAAARIAAAANRTEAMEGWLLVTQWARLLNSNQQQALNRWIIALNSARLGHANIPRDFRPTDESLRALVSNEFVAAAMSDAGFSSSFFQLLSPYDNLAQVLIILDVIYRAEPAAFDRYSELALAIALVFDVPPPPQWPHGQVSNELVSRKQAEPLRVFRFWVESDKSRSTLHRLTNLKASELKFVVDAAAPFAELVWAREKQNFNFGNLPRAYDAISYRTDRVEQNQFSWPGSSYKLSAILAEGGICVDQGYFAGQVGKARGVPTLLFRGAGLDGRHAWFGYLDARKTWQLDVGRYAEQTYVSGVAFDPQTWSDVNDHELAFLAERFRSLPRYRQSRAWLQMAREYLRAEEVDSALAAAKKATDLEPRHVEAWEVRVMAEQVADLNASVRENTWRQAARALQRYPDLYARFMRGALIVLRERGQTSRADHEERMLARKFTEDRSDIAITQAAKMLSRSMADDTPATQLRVFESALRQFGLGAGMDAFDRLVRPFFERAVAEGRGKDAEVILRLTRRLIPAPAGSQFANELEALAESL